MQARGQNLSLFLISKLFQNEFFIISCFLQKYFIICRRMLKSKKRSHNCCKINQYYFYANVYSLQPFQGASQCGYPHSQEKINYYHYLQYTYALFLNYSCTQRHISIYLLMPCPFTGPKIFCARPKINLHIVAVTKMLCQTKR